MKPQKISLVVLTFLLVAFSSNTAFAVAQEMCMADDQYSGQTTTCYNGEQYVPPNCDFGIYQCDDYIQSYNRNRCINDYNGSVCQGGSNELYEPPSCSNPRSSCSTTYTNQLNIDTCYADYDIICTPPPAPPAVQPPLPTINTITELQNLVAPAFNAVLGFVAPTVETMARNTLGTTTLPEPEDKNTGSSVVAPSVSARARTGSPQSYGTNAVAPTQQTYSHKGNQLPMSTQQAVPPYNNLPKFETISRTGQQNLNIKIQTTCFPTNLRGVNNPISAHGDLVVKGKYYVYTNAGSIPTPAETEFKNFEIRYPAKAAIHGGSGANPIQLLPTVYPAVDNITPTTPYVTRPLVSFEDLTLDNTTKSYLIAKLVTVKIPLVFSASYDMNTNTITSSTNRFIIKNVRFEQIVPAITAEQLVEYTSVPRWQAAIAIYRAQTGNHGALPPWLTYTQWKNSIISGVYMGQSGPVGTNGGSSINVTQSSDGTSYEIKASLPGDLTMCDGYYSPLMVFFDEQRPHFTNISDFKMNHNFKTYWPEAKHPGYFVGLPNKNGRIDSYEDLFGEDTKYKNGFDKLAQYDKNKDGIINHKDPIYKKLVLWQDKDGKGIFNKKNTIKLSKKIEAINLKYTDSIEHVSIGAEYRQKSNFAFKSKGVKKTGVIVDVWFKPVLNEIKPELASQ